MFAHFILHTFDRTYLTNMLKHIYDQNKLKVLDHHYPIPSVCWNKNMKNTSQNPRPQPYKPNHQNTKTPTTDTYPPLKPTSTFETSWFGGHGAIWSGWMDGCLRSGFIPNLTQRCTRSFSKAVGLVGLIGLVGWVGWLVGW